MEETGGGDEPAANSDLFSGSHKYDSIKRRESSEEIPAY